MLNRLKLATLLPVVTLALAGICGEVAMADDSQSLTSNVVTDPGVAEFVYVDVENFARATEMIASGGRRFRDGPA